MRCSLAHVTINVVFYINSESYRKAFTSETPFELALPYFLPSSPDLHSNILIKMRGVSSLPIVAAFAILNWLLVPVLAAHVANSSATRTYYVAAVEEDWDYTPT